MVSSYIGLDQKIKNKYESKHDQLNILNKDYIINKNEINQLKDPLNLI